MAMTRTTTILSSGLLALAMGCSAGDRDVPGELDCAAVESPYEFLEVRYFDDKVTYQEEGGFPITGQTGWFQYADPTPGGVPTLSDNILTDGIVEASNLGFAPLDDNLPARCGDTLMMEIEAYGHNFWGSGFGNWTLNTSPADASAYEGISFWVRSAPNADKSFIFYVDDPRTMILPPLAADGSGAFLASTDPTKDLDGDGILSYGDIAPNTECRFPPPESLGEAACYNGGMNAPSAVTRVPAVNECGNAFHTVVDMTEEWQLVLIPWSKLAQWPCPNRLDGGIDTTRISKFEIKLEQGTNYDFWIDNIAFYKRR